MPEELMGEPPSRRRVYPGALGLLIVLALTSGAGAQGAAPPPESLRGCVDASFGAACFSRPWRLDFLLTGDALVDSYTFEADACRGFVAVGARHAQDVALLVHDASGQVVASSQGPTTIAYASHCGRAGERVFTSVRVRDGQGEVAFAVLASGASQHPALDALARCPYVGATRPALLDLGPEPEGRSIAQTLEQTAAALDALGYRPLRLLGYGMLENGRHEARALTLDPSRCYALLAAGSRGVVDLDLRVFDATLAAPLAADLTRQRDALVKFCAQEPGRYVLDIAVFQGEGAYAVQAFELDETDAALPAGVTGQARIPYREMARRMRQRGLDPEVITAGIVRAGEGLRVPLQLAGRQCHAVAAVSAVGPFGPGIELSLTDDHGELVALDAVRSADPLVFDCPAQDARRTVVVRAKDARRPLRFLLLRASSPALALEGAR